MIDSFLSIYLPRFFDWVIETSIMASILVGLILLVKTVLRHMLTPRWHYLLWLVLIVRLLLPWSPDSSYSIYSILPNGDKTTVSYQSQPVVSSENERMHETTGISGTKAVTNDRSYNAGTLQTSKESDKETTTLIEQQKKEPISLYTIALYIWLTGVIVLGFATYLVNLRLNYYIQQQPKITDKKIINIFEKCKKSMSVQQCIPLLLAGKISSPTVLGFFRPRVLLSSAHINRLTEQQLRHIFYHELAHIKRRDVGFNWLMHSLLILNWFNPILWYAYVCMREDQELACDAYALTFMEEEEKISYGLTIISLLEHYSNYYQVPSLANLSRNKRTLKRRIFMIKKFQKKSYRWSALGIIVVIVISSLSLLIVRADGSNEMQEEQIKNKVTTLDQKKQSGNNSLYTPPAQEESYKDLTKEEVLTKLLNTVDYFHTAIGNFETYDVYYDHSTSKAVVEYKISNKNLIGGYEKTINIPDEKIVGSKIETDEIFYNDQRIWQLDNDEKTYYTTDYESDPSREIVKPEEVFSININKIYDSYDKFRERPVGGNSSLFPYEITAKYLRFLNHWDIEKQNEELLGHNTIVLYGSIDKSIVNIMQPQADSFRFWVDRDTGILLKREIYNANGEIISYLHPESLSVNVPINTTQFIPLLENYHEMQIPDPLFKDSKETEIEVIEHADSIREEVETVLNILRTKIPFLYEFSDPELQIFSASMERYKEFNQAYLTYSYKKAANERGSGSRLLYVRIYNKDSVVRSFGDFDQEKGEKLDTFTLNGIQWNVFEIKNTPDVHYIGSLGDYMYEVVTQGISNKEAKILLESFEKSKSIE